MKCAAIAAVLCLATVAPARAELPIGLIEDMARGVVSRTRRAIAIGPEAGYVAGVTSEGTGLQGVSFGLALYTFDIPTVFDLRGMIEERIRARVQEHIKQVIASGGTPPTNLEGLVKQIGKDVIDEVVGEEIVPRTLEKPRTKVVLEGVALLDPGGFQVRAGVSRGLGPASLGFGGGYQRTSGASFGLVGAELSLHLTPIGSSWTPVVDGFLRADLTINGDDSFGAFLLGARLTLDLL